MAQKTNPNLLRLENTNQHFKSCWYAAYYYSEQLHNNFKINKYIRTLLQRMQRTAFLVYINNLQQSNQIWYFYTKKTFGRWFRSRRRRSLWRVPRKSRWSTSTPPVLDSLFALGPKSPSVVAKSCFIGDIRPQGAVGMVPSARDKLILIISKMFSRLTLKRKNIIKPNISANNLKVLLEKGWLGKTFTEVPLNPCGFDLTPSQIQKSNCRQDFPRVSLRKSDEKTLNTDKPFKSVFSTLNMVDILAHFYPQVLVHKKTVEKLSPGIENKGLIRQHHIVRVKKFALRRIKDTLNKNSNVIQHMYKSLVNLNAFATNWNPHKSLFFQPRKWREGFTKREDIIGLKIGGGTHRGGRSQGHVSRSLGKTLDLDLVRSHTSLTSLTSLRDVSDVIKLRSHLKEVQNKVGHSSAQRMLALCSLHNDLRKESSGLSDISSAVVPSVHPQGAVYKVNLLYPIKVSKPSQNSDAIATKLIDFLNRRFTYHRLRRIILKDVMGSPIVKGFRVTLSGRINPRSRKAQKASTRTFQAGETELHVFSAKVQFTQAQAKTRFGKLGIKVWVCYR